MQLSEKKKQKLIEIYNEYAREIKDIKDIKRWCTRKTISEKVLHPERTNEQKVLNAIQNAGYVEGDRAYFFFRSDKTLCLVEHFSGDYDQIALLKKLFDTAKIFATVIDTKSTFPNYSLKKNQELWKSL